MNPTLNFSSTGNGVPFVFQHGLGAKLRQAQDLLAPQKHIQCITLDCPGHGLSPFNPNLLPSFANYAEELISVLDHLDIKSAYFGGISMGAGISLHIALQNPELVKGLVLVRPAWLNQVRPENLLILLEAGKRILSPNGKMEFEALAEFQAMKASLPLAARSVLGQFNRDQLEYGPQVLEYMVNDRPFEDLAQLTTIKQPCLIIGNEDDPLHPFEMAKTIGQHIPNAQVEKVVSRYVDNRAHREQVNQLVADWLLANPA